VRICILAAGAGGMYCGSCLRDNALAGALKRLGHQVTLVPLFSPVRTDVADQSNNGEVFFGGVNIYLQHASPLFRHTPRALDWLLDRKWLLNVATKYGSGTPPEQLVGLTLDLLLGEEGHAAKEVRRLAGFLRDDVRPDVVTLPNLMFAGVARAFQDELKLPVVCELTGEDVFLEALGVPGCEQVRDAIRRQVPHIDAFVATSGAYAEKMAEYLGVPRERIDVVHPGLPKEFLDAVPPARSHANGRPPTVGYLARICPEKGLAHLVDGMIHLRQRPGLGNAQLRVGGYLGKKDQPFFEQLQRTVNDSPLRGGMTYVGELDQAGKIALLDSVDVFSVPAHYPEAKGIYLLESLAHGLPAVQPRLGSFPELLARTDGGILIAPNDPDALADGLETLLRDPDRRESHGRSGRQVVHTQFTDERMARDMLTIFEKVRR